MALLFYIMCYAYDDLTCQETKNADGIPKTHFCLDKLNQELIFAIFHPQKVKYYFSEI